MLPKNLTMSSLQVLIYLNSIKQQNGIAATTTADLIATTGFASATIARAKDQLRKNGYIRQVAVNIYEILQDIKSLDK